MFFFNYKKSRAIAAFLNHGYSPKTAGIDPNSLFWHFLALPNECDNRSG